MNKSIAIKNHTSNILQNNLTRLGVDIITEKEEYIHVSGHPYQDELKEMYDWVKPDCVIPVHGEIRHLHKHAQFAKDCGFDSLIPENGTLIDMKQLELLVIVRTLLILAANAL